MRLKSLLILLTSSIIISCAEGVPPAPAVAQYAPIFSPENEVKYFYGVMSNDSSKDFNLPNELARKRGMICLDVDGYTAMEIYKKDLEELARKRCR